MNITNNLLLSNDGKKKNVFRKIEIQSGTNFDEKWLQKVIYENIKNVIGHNHYWGGIKNYNPETDPFYRKFISQMTSYKEPSKSKVIPKTIIQKTFDF